ncbi:MAG: HD domain-containing protein [Deltaproteobacteria bacterium]|nr:HD domain-containing protein [Deltaproteobacteria bacterium]
MIRKALLLKIFDAAYMQRWNDKIRPVDLIELDKQAHKMVIAYFLGKFEEGKKDLDWIEIIEGGIFELLQRIVITDLKPPIFYKIKEDPDKYKKLNEWVYSDLESILSPLDSGFCERFKDYFSSIDETLNKRILSAAHFYSTKWEFNIIEWANPNSYEIDTIKKDLQKKQEKYYDLKGIAALAMYDKYRYFVDLCGQLRFQSRWANLHRIPKTSVLGHSLFVATVSYLFSLEAKACRQRCINNYFTGLFHDLPEVLTRDIISPVKRSVREIDYLIKEYEKEQMEKEVYSLIPENWYPEFKMFTENEFESIVTVGGKRKNAGSQEINEKYNEDRFNPRDGELIKAADDLSAFVEAYVAILNGSPSMYFEEARSSVVRRYSGVNVAGVKLGEIYADFE